MSSHLLGVAAALVLTAFIMEMLRRGILREKFAALWLVVSCCLIILAAFPEILTAAARLVGIQVPSNLLFLISAVVLLAISVQLSHEISRLEGRTRRLAEELSLLRHEVATLRERLTR